MSEAMAPLLGPFTRKALLTIALAVVALAALLVVVQVLEREASGSLSHRRPGAGD